MTYAQRSEGRNVAFQADSDLPRDHDAPLAWPYEAFPETALQGTVADRFAAMAGRFGERLAVRDATRSFTYAELAGEAERVAAAVGHAIAGREGPVAIFLSNEARYAAAILGVLACGRGYVGLDPGHPDERNRTIADHAGIAAVVSAGPAAASARALADSIPVVDLDRIGEPPPCAGKRARPDDVAWIIYTSGSTGEPKGVYQDHRGLLHDVMQSVNSLHLSPEDRQVLFVSPSLISGARVTFGALLSGGSLHCLPPQQLDPRTIAQAINDLGITVFRSVPALFRTAVQGLAPRSRFETLRLVLLGGDRVDVSDYVAFSRACTDAAVFGTHLGATECSTLYLQWFVRNGAKLEGRLPVGRAIPERSVTIVRDDGTPAADGEIGEFVVASRYLARGYWRAPELTASAFGTDPADASIRVFRTGDLGLRRADGLYEHHGRKDQQIKLHGNRIELGAIENALRNCRGVRDGAIVVRRDGAGVPRAVVAYVELMPATRGLLPRHVRAMLAAQLPPHMVPSTVTILDDLPRLPNLKVDRMALAGMDTDRAARVPVAGRDALVDEIAALFQAILETGEATQDDTVLSLGGDSLQAVAIAHALEERFGVPIEAGDEPLTIREIADRIARVKNVRADQAVRGDA